MNDKQNLPALQRGYNALSEEQQTAHREKIATLAEAILSNFWADDGTSLEVKTLQRREWIEQLKHYKLAEIEDAWITYQRTGPRSKNGRLLRPLSGDILNIITDKHHEERRRAMEAMPTRQTPDGWDLRKMERDKWTDEEREAHRQQRKEEADAILKEVGFNIRRFK